MGGGNGTPLMAGIITILLASVLTTVTALLQNNIDPEDSNNIIIHQVTDDQSNTRSPVGAHTQRKFNIFMKMYNKNYTTREEYVHRLGIFAKNLARAAEHQVLDPTAVHDVTPFSDLSEEEFETMFTGLRAGWSPVNEVSCTAPPLDVHGLPKNFDWREKGAVTEVKFQGACGSCWAFSATGAIEGANYLATGKLLSLSEQQLVDCDHTCDPEDKESCNSGCNGGLMTNAYKYLIEAGGIEEETTYPYEGKPGKCRFKPEKIAARVANFTNIPLEETQIAANLVHRGPLAVGLNSVFMQTYVGGVSCPLICSKRRLTHGVLLVGYGAKGFSMLRLGERPYWIIKNSWGKDWGENGYYRVCKGYGMCGMNTMVSAVSTAI